MVDLQRHIQRLREQEKDKPSDALLFWGTPADKNYLSYLKGCVGAHTTYVRQSKIDAITEVKAYCKNKKVTKVISTSVDLLRLLLNWDKRAVPSLANYSGSYFKIDGLLDKDPYIEIIFVPALRQLVTVPYAKFMFTRFIKKLTDRDFWFPVSKFSWSILNPSNEVDYFYNVQTDAFLIAVDIETFKENAVIRCISFCYFYVDPIDGSLNSHSLLLPVDSDWALAVLRKWCWQLKAPKVFQNGKYDIAYLCRYNAPVYNYLYDTANLFHSWYSELPKDLGFLNSFFVREAMYWKDLSETTDEHEYFKYCCLDTWGTGNTFLAMLYEAPDWAINNYLLEFPNVFPCHLAEMTGIERDMERLEEAKAKQDKIIEEKTASLNTILGVPKGETFNTNSPKQVKSVLHILGCKDIKTTNEKDLKKARFRHPFNAKIINAIIDVRKARKLVSTYLTAGKEFHRLDGTGNRILYALNPHGTDTSRQASKEHHFWCGLQAQNIPRGPSVKMTFKADPGFLFGEADLEQAESRDTAYISGDAALIDAVENSPDFHSQNASSFFGIPFEELWDIENSKSKNKEIRDLSKRTNHGANYNMGAYMLVETMGEENVSKARRLLDLPKQWSYIEVADYLLKQFHKAYPKIAGTMHAGVIDEIGRTRMIKSQAIHYPSLIHQSLVAEEWEKNMCMLG